VSAELPKELLNLLERIIFCGPPDGDFQSNKNLQNLLILTGVKVDSKRVMDYLKRLNNYEGLDIANILKNYQLYEEAFFVYKKFNKGQEAIQVLLENLHNIERAKEFAEYWNKPDVWSIYNAAQHTSNSIDTN